MAIHALQESFLDARPFGLGQTEPSPRKEKGVGGQIDVTYAQPTMVLIVAGLGALALLAPMMLGYTPYRPETGVLLLSIAALSLLAAFGVCQREFARAKAEESLLAAHIDAIEGAGGVVLRWDLVDGALIWSGNAASILQTSPGRVPTNFRDLRPFLNPDHSLYASIADALQNSAHAVNWPLRVKDGEGGWRLFSLRGAIDRNSGTEGPWFRGVLRPAEQSGQPQEEFVPPLTAILESLPISFAMWDCDNRLLFCNRKFRQLYKIASAAVESGAPFEQVQAQARETIAQRPPAVRGPTGLLQLQDKQLADGTWLQVGEYWTKDGTLVSVGTDITVAKLSERQIREREQQMRARVDGFEQSRRQLEIQARQLRELAESYNEEKIRAEAANQAKSEFLANVSHELRTPLNAIIGFSEMMRDGVLGPIGNPKYEAYVRDINASGRYLLEMINDILDMSKIEAGRMTLSPEWIGLSSIFQECLTFVQPSAIEGKVELILGGAANVELYADKRALKQVLINLLANAVKFTPPGGRVALRAYRYRGSVRVAIVDTGVGIAKHDLGRLGRPFEQVSNQLTKGHKGTGLGLAISRSLIEMHGGRLDIKSRVGEGTTVTCILPMRDDKDTGQEAA